VNAPPRVIIAVIVAGVLAILAVSAMLALPHAQALRPLGTWRWLLAVAVALVLAALAAWVVFIAPAYWD
jgi:undecaprenyl pyrophosphate phosphatase UppP